MNAALVTADAGKNRGVPCTLFVYDQLPIP